MKKVIILWTLLILFLLVGGVWGEQVKGWMGLAALITGLVAIRATFEHLCPEDVIIFRRIEPTDS